MTDPVTEADLLGYVDDQIDIQRRIEVEGHLARNPDAAARVMADLKIRDALRLSLASSIEGPPERMRGAAARLERGLVWRSIGHKLRRVAAVVALIGFGWLAHSEVGLFAITDSEASPKPPAFVEDAVRSHHTALVRARMTSQPEVAAYDPAEIMREIGVEVPPLRRDWRVLDVQVFPSRNGHSVEMIIATENLGRVSFFATQSGEFNVTDPATVSRADGTRTIYWQTGQLAYALTGAAPEKAIERAARDLAERH